jgi:hypothetical protein
LSKSGPFSLVRGRKLRLSLQRRWVTDLMAASLSTPTVGAERTIRVSRVADARRSLADPPGWTALILKAYALVAARRPELRRIYLSTPWAHLYEHPCSVASVVVERDWQGEPGVFLDRIVSPETSTITQIDETVRKLVRDPIESVAGFRLMIFVSKLPWLVRRPLWWFGLRCSGIAHAYMFGTFTINSMAAPRSRAMNLMTPWTLMLLHGPVEPPGVIHLCAAFDHRVLDGMVVLRMLGEVEEVLNEEIADEFRGMTASVDTAAPTLSDLRPVEP